jgi:hypothetical protein
MNMGALFAARIALGLMSATPSDIGQFVDIYQDIGAYTKDNAKGEATLEYRYLWPRIRQRKPAWSGSVVVFPNQRLRGQEGFLVIDAEGAYFAAVPPAVSPMELKNPEQFRKLMFPSGSTVTAIDVAFRGLGQALHAGRWWGEPFERAPTETVDEKELTPPWEDGPLPELELTQISFDEIRPLLENDIANRLRTSHQRATESYTSVFEFLKKCEPVAGPSMQQVIADQRRQFASDPPPALH